MQKFVAWHWAPEWALGGSGGRGGGGTTAGAATDPELASAGQWLDTTHLDAVAAIVEPKIRLALSTVAGGGADWGPHAFGVVALRKGGQRGLESVRLGWQVPHGCQSSAAAKPPTTCSGNTHLHPRCPHEHLLSQLGQALACP